MRAAPCSLKLTHHIRVIRVLLNNPASGNAPRISSAVIQHTRWFITGKIVVECNCRFTIEQGIKTGNYLFYRTLSAFMGIPESNRTPDQSFRAPVSCARPAGSH